MTALPRFLRNAPLMPSQLPCASSTAMRPGTTRWNSTTVTLPAVRVRTPCASMASSALAKMTHRIPATVSATSSIRLPTDPRSLPQARSQDVERDQRGDGWVKAAATRSAAPARSRPAARPSSTRRSRRPHVGHDALAAPAQGRRRPGPPAADQHQRPGQGPRRAVQRDAQDRRLRRARVLPAQPRLAPNTSAVTSTSAPSATALRYSALSCPLGVVRVGGLPGEPQGHRRVGRGGDVDHRLQRVRVEGDAAGY